MKYKILRKFAGGTIPIGSIIDEENISGLINVHEALAEGCIEGYFEKKMVSAAPENKAMIAPENKTLKIEVS